MKVILEKTIISFHFHFQTRLLVTHGLAHLPDCNSIVVMDEGKIVEIGTYDELMAKEGKFAEIIKSQNNSSESKIVVYLEAVEEIFQIHSKNYLNI